MLRKGIPFLAQVTVVSRRNSVLETEAVQTETVFCATLKQMSRIYRLRIDLFENAVKNRIHIAKVPVQIKRIFQSGTIQENLDARIRDDALAKIRFSLPCAHGVFLHPFVSIFARGARFDQIQQELAGEYQAACGV